MKREKSKKEKTRECLIVFVIASITAISFIVFALALPYNVDADPLPMPYFSNITSDVGLTGVSAFRISIADVNGDGYPDLLLHERANEGTGDVLDKQFLYLNVQGDDPNDPYSRRFIDFTEESGIRANRRGTNEGRHSSLAVFADVDNDGDLDMFSGLYAHRLENYTDIGDRNDLFLNDGTGHFTLAPDTVFHDEGILNTSSATFLDYDLDGNIDLFTGNWFTAYKADSIEDQLYRGNGDGTFTNVTYVTGIIAGHQPTYSVTAADTNNDGLMDLFAGNYCRDHSIHWQNNGDGTFTQVQGSTNYDQYVVCSWGSMPRDFDNDGDIDLFKLIVHGYEGGVRSTILVNENNFFTWGFDRTIRDQPQPYHHADYYASWFDMNNDGLSDLTLGEGNCATYGQPDICRLHIFKQNESNILDDVTAEGGLIGVKEPHPVIAFDYDLDGDEDLIVGLLQSGNQVQVWRNDIGTLKNWITVSLVGAGTPGHSNRSAIGARVEVNAEGKTYTREVYAGNGHFGPQAPLSLTFGIGEAAKADSIKVYWPNENRTSTEIRNVAINQFFSITEIDQPLIKKILSDSTWKSYDSLQAGWETPGFDDSGWRNAYAPYPFLSGYPPTFYIPGTTAVYMWDWPYAGTPTGKNGPLEAWFRKTFNLASAPPSIVSAQVIINADDRFSFYVNGANLLNDVAGTLSGPYMVDIKPYLVQGQNVFAIYACDGCIYNRSWEWVLVDATIEIEVIEGDLNGDGCVDRADLSIILACIRSRVSCDPSYDLNSDGVVNIADARKLVTLFTNPRGVACVE